MRLNEFFYIDVLADSTKFKCNWFMSSFLCLVRLSQWWKFMGRVTYSVLFALHISVVYRFLYSLCMASWGFCSAYRSWKQERNSFKRLFLLLDEGSLTFNTQPEWVSFVFMFFETPAISAFNSNESLSF